MSNTKNICSNRGRLRNLKLAEHLAEDGHAVRIFGFKNIEISAKMLEAVNLEETIEGSDL
ncbi:MAG: hypothetical protein ACM3KR_04010 [Deltaproteobacteria bacterium]